MNKISIRRYAKEDEAAWDRFVLDSAVNGTFLQTRKFLNYHPKERFKDCSLMILKGVQQIIAVIPACEEWQGNQKYFWSHKGSTYGGILIAPGVHSAVLVEQIFETLENFLKEEEFAGVFIKTVPDIYQKTGTDILDYFFYQKGYNVICELNYYLRLNRYAHAITSQFSAAKRRDYQYSLRNNLTFHELGTNEEIAEFYLILQKNLKKFSASCVHTYEELLDLKYNRLKNEIEFYGVFQEKRMVAGSMVFLFGNRVFHTQYLSSDSEYLQLYPMHFLIYNLISCALEKNIDIFSLGICTEQRGKYLNMGLSRFKEGFGAEFCINRSYEKQFYSDIRE